MSEPRHNPTLAAIQADVRKATATTPLLVLPPAQFFALLDLFMEQITSIMDQRQAEGGEAGALRDDLEALLAIGNAVLAVKKAKLERMAGKISAEQMQAVSLQTMQVMGAAPLKFQLALGRGSSN